MIVCFVGFLLYTGVKLIYTNPVFGRREIRAREIGAREMEEKVGISLVWRTEESETRD